MVILSWLICVFLVFKCVQFCIICTKIFNYRRKLSDSMFYDALNQYKFLYSAAENGRLDRYLVLKMWEMTHPEFGDPTRYIMKKSPYTDMPENGPFDDETADRYCMSKFDKNICKIALQCYYIWKRRHSKRDSDIIYAEFVN